MKTITLSDLEHKILLDFLKVAKNEMITAGSNDYSINFDPKDQEEVNVVKDFFDKYMGEDFPPPDYIKGRLDCSDFVVLEYLETKLNTKHKNKMSIK